MARRPSRNLSVQLTVGADLVITALFHPICTARTLAYIGYEPIPPRLIGGTWYLPNVFQYLNFLWETEGFWETYAGVLPRVLAVIVGKMSENYVLQKLGENAIFHEQEVLEGSLLTELQIFKMLRKSTLNEVTVIFARNLLTIPLQVISVRMIARLAGHDDIYQSFLGSILEIFRSDGVWAFFAGFIPLMLHDISFVCLRNITTFISNRFVLQTKEDRELNVFIMEYLMMNILSPLDVCTTCSMVAGSGLKAGRPPAMSEDLNWLGLWNELQQMRQLKRHTSIFSRAMCSQIEA